MYFTFLFDVQFHTPLLYCYVRNYVETKIVVLFCSIVCTHITGIGKYKPRFDFHPHYSVICCFCFHTATLCFSLFTIISYIFWFVFTIVFLHTWCTWCMWLLRHVYECCSILSSLSNIRMITIICMQLRAIALKNRFDAIYIYPSNME